MSASLGDVPVFPADSAGCLYSGLSKREWFAGQAVCSGYMFGQRPELIAKDAVKLADALLVELAKGEPK